MTFLQGGKRFNLSNEGGFVRGLSPVVAELLLAGKLAARMQTHAHYESSLPYQVLLGNNLVVCWS